MHETLLKTFVVIEHYNDTTTTSRQAERAQQPTVLLVKMWSLLVQVDKHGFHFVHIPYCLILDKKQK